MAAALRQQSAGEPIQIVWLKDLKAAMNGETPEEDELEEDEIIETPEEIEYKETEIGEASEKSDNDDLTPEQRALVDDMQARIDNTKERLGEIKEWLDQARTAFDEEADEDDPDDDDPGDDELDDDKLFMESENQQQAADATPWRMSKADVSTPLKKKEGCYIATVVYGSYDAPEVRVLRRFREERLKKAAAGRWFIRTYYRLSPPLTEKLRNAERMNRLVRRALDCWVRRLERRR